MKNTLRLFGFLVLATVGLHAQTNTPANGVHVLAPGELPAGIKLMPNVTFAYLADAEGLYTMVPQNAILQFDPTGSLVKTPSNADPKNFRRFGVFYAAHQPDLAVVAGRPDPTDPRQLVIYDGDVDALPKTVKVVIAVNDKNIPITVFERQPGEPLVVPKK